MTKETAQTNATVHNPRKINITFLSITLDKSVEGASVMFQLQQLIQTTFKSPPLDPNPVKSCFCLKTHRNGTLPEYDNLGLM